MSLKFAFNLKSNNFEKTKYIIVGDNPGKNEFEQNKFFIGHSGIQLRNFFKEKGLIEDFDEECIIFNKTFLSTDKTNDLIDVRKEINLDNFNRTLFFTANEIANYSNNLNVPILIFGKSKLEKGKIFHPFWTKILELCKSDKIFVFSHPSNSNFTKEWNKYQAIEKDKSNLELLNHIGQLNYNSLIS